MSHKGQLGSASSLTNLSSEPDYPLPRTHSASEIFEPGSAGSSRRLKARQRARDLRHSIADSRSDYYNNRRPQSMSLSSQIPAHSSLRSTSSVGALGTITETEGQGGSQSVADGEIGSDQLFPEPPDTPLFHYNPMSSLSELAASSRGGSLHQINSRHYSQTSINQASVMVGSGDHQPASNGNGYINSPTNTTTAVPIHASELITQQFIPLYLNPVTGQMYSHHSSDDYFRPVSSSSNVSTRPPKPDKRLEEREPLPLSYVKFTGFLAVLFCLCGNFLVLVACSLPALFCAHKVHQMKSQKKYREAKKLSEYVLCFNILGIVLHVVLMLAAIVTAVVVLVVAVWIWCACA